MYLHVMRNQLIIHSVPIDYLACVASVSVTFSALQNFICAGNGAREQNKDARGRGGGRTEKRKIRFFFSNQQGITSV